MPMTHNVLVHILGRGCLTRTRQHKPQLTPVPAALRKSSSMLSSTVPVSGTLVWSLHLDTQHTHSSKTLGSNSKGRRIRAGIHARKEGNASEEVGKGVQVIFPFERNILPGGGGFHAVFASAIT